MSLNTIINHPLIGTRVFKKISCAVKVFLLLLILLPFLGNLHAEAQEKMLAKYESHSGGSSAVKDHINVDTDDDTYAEVKAYGGAALGIGAYSGSIQMKFDETVPANQWSYIRVDLDGGLVDALLGGSLGDLLGGIVSGIALGDLNIEVSAINSSETEVLKRTSNQGFDTDRVRLLQTGEGHYLIGLKPDQDYNRVRLKASSVTLLLGTVFTNKVYSAFTYDDSGDNCGRPLATSFDGSGGLSLSVLDNENQYLERAIDDDPDTYSELKTGGVLSVDVAGSYSQYFYFPTTSAADHTFNVKLALATSGVLNLDALGG